MTGISTVPTHGSSRAQAIRHMKDKKTYRRFQRHVRPQQMPLVMMEVAPDPGGPTLQQACSIAGACFVRLLLACFRDYCHMFAQLVAMEGGGR